MVDHDGVKSDAGTAEALSDDPRLSSAALCIDLSLLGASFRPEFTHQCAPGEIFRGCRPCSQALTDARNELLLRFRNEEHKDENIRKVDSEDCSLSRKGMKGKSGSSAKKPCGSLLSHDEATENYFANDVSLIHPSHGHHPQTTKELQVRITLAPSCRTCHVQVDMAPVPSNKRRQGSRSEQKGKEGTKTAGKFVPTGVGKGKDEDSDAEGKRELTESDILKMIVKGLPVLSKTLREVENDYLAAPVGEVITEYAVERRQPKDDESLSRTRSKTSDKFVISLADGRDPVPATYHDQVQKLAMWFIETGDEVDISEDSAGYWKALYLFHKLPSPKSSKESRFALAGYVTLYHFYAIFHNPAPGVIIRVCQALIFPPHQRQGHGKRLLQCVYDIAHGTYLRLDNIPPRSLDKNVVQVNVEDPAPAFVALRIRVDYERFAPQLVEFLPEVSVHDEAFFTSLTESQLSQLSARTKITPRQLQIVCELVKLKIVLGFEAPNKLRNAQRALDMIHKQFRLMVKRRLNREHREDLSALSSKEEKQAFLADRFEEDMALYRTILRSENA